MVLWLGTTFRLAALIHRLFSFVHSFFYLPLYLALLAVYQYLFNENLLLTRVELLDTSKHRIKMNEQKKIHIEIFANTKKTEHFVLLCAQRSFKPTKSVNQQKSISGLFKMACFSLETNSELLWHFLKSTYSTVWRLHHVCITNSPYNHPFSLTYSLTH